MRRHERDGGAYASACGSRVTYGATNSRRRRGRVPVRAAAGPSAVTAVTAGCERGLLLLLRVSHDAVEHLAALVEHVIVVQHLVVAHVAPALHRLRRQSYWVPLGFEVMQPMLVLVPLPAPATRAREA